MSLPANRYPLRRGHALAVQIGKHVALGPGGKLLDPAHRVKRERAVEMGEQRAAARGLPFERRPERSRLDRDQEEVGLAGKMLGRGLNDLIGGGKMDVAVAAVDRRAAENA